MREKKRETERERAQSKCMGFVCTREGEKGERERGPMDEEIRDSTLFNVIDVRLQHC